MSGEKTEKPTPARLKKARREGQTPRTPELGAWAGIAVVSMVLPWALSHFMTGSRELFVRSAAAMAHPSVDALTPLGRSAIELLLGGFLPIGLSLLFVGVLASGAQGGIRFATKAIKPSLKKLNPWHGVKRMFGVQGIWESTKALIKCTALALTLWSSTGEARTLLAASGALPLTVVVDATVAAALAMFRVAAVTGLALAVADYAVTRRRTMKKLRMSVSEVKQEHKQAEGDPQLKGAIRSKQLAMSRNRMMSEVAGADVMVVNPVHVAVAIRYDPTDGTPRVVAKGSGEVAARLREKASEHRVPIVQDIPLARALHHSCALGQQVPVQLFTAVARVLAFVMHLRSRGVAAGFHQPHFPPPPLEGLPRAGRRR